jgi:hypothetical protein
MNAVMDVKSTYRISFGLLREDNSRFDDTFIVEKVHLDTVSFTQFPNMDVSSELVDFVFEIGVKVSASIFHQ